MIKKENGSRGIDNALRAASNKSKLLVILSETMDLALPVLRMARGFTPIQDGNDEIENSESKPLLLSVEDAEYFASKTLHHCISVLIRCDRTEKPEDIARSFCDIVRFISSCIKIGFDELNTQLICLISQPSQSSIYPSRHLFYDIYGCNERKTPAMSRRDASYKFARPLLEFEEQTTGVAGTVLSQPGSKKVNQKGEKDRVAQTNVVDLGGSDDGDEDGATTSAGNDNSNADNDASFSCSRYLLDSIEAFGLAGGFDAVVQRIENVNNKPSLLTVKSLSDIVFSSSEFLGDNFLNKYSKLIETAIRSYLLGLTNDELRSVDRICIKNILQDLTVLCKESITDSQKAISELISRIDGLRKSFALKLLRCPHMQPRLAGLQDLRDLIKLAKDNQTRLDELLRKTKRQKLLKSDGSKAFPVNLEDMSESNARNEDYGVDDDSITNLTIKSISDWLIDEEIISLLFSPEYLHTEVLKRCVDVVLFLAEDDSISEGDITKIWQAANNTGVHDSVRRSIFDILGKVLRRLDSDLLRFVWSDLLTKVQKHDSFSLYLVFEFTKVALDDEGMKPNTSSISKDVNQLVALLKNPSNAYGLWLFWQLIQDQPNLTIESAPASATTTSSSTTVPFEVYDLSLKYLMELCNMYFIAQFHNPILLLCAENIVVRSSSVSQSILLMMRILEINLHRKGPHVTNEQEILKKRKFNEMIQLINMHLCKLKGIETPASEIPIEYFFDRLIDNVVLYNEKYSLSASSMIDKDNQRSSGDMEIVGDNNSNSNSVNSIRADDSQIVQAESTSNEMSRYNFIEGLEHRLNFIELLIREYKDCVDRPSMLSVEIIRSLWKGLCSNAFSPQSLELFMRWLNKQVLSADVQVYEAIVVEHFPFVHVPALLPNALMLFQTCFQKLNESLQKIVIPPYINTTKMGNLVQPQIQKLQFPYALQRNFIVFDMDLVGMSTLWDIALYSENARVISDACNYISMIYKYAADGVDAEGSGDGFVRKCIALIQKVLLKRQANNNDSTASTDINDSNKLSLTSPDAQKVVFRLISMLKGFINSYEEITRAKEELNNHLKLNQMQNNQKEEEVNSVLIQANKKKILMERKKKMFDAFIIPFKSFLRIHPFDISEQGEISAVFAHIKEQTLKNRNQYPKLLGDLLSKESTVVHFFSSLGRKLEDSEKFSAPDLFELPRLIIIIDENKNNFSQDTKSPGEILNNTSNFDLLFSLLSLNAPLEFVDSVWNLISVLPSNPLLMERLISSPLEFLSKDTKEESETWWSSILDSRSSYKLLYNLQAMEKIVTQQHASLTSSPQPNMMIGDEVKSDPSSAEKNEIYVKWYHAVIKTGGLSRMIDLLLTVDFSDPVLGSQRNYCVASLCGLIKWFMFDFDGNSIGSKDISSSILLDLSKKLLRFIYCSSKSFSTMEVESEQQHSPCLTFDFSSKSALSTSNDGNDKVSVHVARRALELFTSISIYFPDMIQEHLSGKDRLFVSAIRESLVSCPVTVIRDATEREFQRIFSTSSQNPDITKMYPSLFFVLADLIEFSCEQNQESANLLSLLSSMTILIDSKFIEADDRNIWWISLFYLIFEKIVNHRTKETWDQGSIDDIMIQKLLNFAAALLSVKPLETFFILATTKLAHASVLISSKDSKINEVQLLIETIFKRCLFDIPDQNINDPNSSPICRRNGSRNAAFKLLLQIVCSGLNATAKLSNFDHLLKLLSGLHRHTYFPPNIVLQQLEIFGKEFAKLSPSELCLPSPFDEEKDCANDDGSCNGGSKKAMKLSAKREIQLEERERNWNYDPSSQIKSDCGYVGLRNMGCTCYMNSLFQQLFMIPGFRHAVINFNEKNNESNGKSNGDGEEDALSLHNSVTLVQNLRNLFISLQETYRRSVDTADFCATSCALNQGNPVNIREQQDVDEFFNRLMENLEKGLKTTNSDGILHHTFGGVLCNQIICEGCPHRSERLEEFMVLQLDVKNKASIIDSLNSYVQGEMLDGDNKYLCEPCGVKRDAKKRACLSALPNSLIIHLKRFDFDLETLQKIKINDRCEFPFDLDMFPYTSDYLDASKDIQSSVTSSGEINERAASTAQENTSSSPKYPPDYYKYELKGILVHSGIADSGHYYSFIKERSPRIGSGEENCKWLKFNDEIVDWIDPEELPDETFGGTETSYQFNQITKQKIETILPKTESAYLLIYERKQEYNAVRVSKETKLNASPFSPRLNQDIQDLLKRVWNENKNLISDYVTFEPCYINFMGNFFDVLLESEELNPDGQAAGSDISYHSIVSASASRTFFLFSTSVLAHIKEKFRFQSTISQLKRFIETKGKISGANEILHLIESDGATCIRHMLIRCTSENTRREFADFLRFILQFLNSNRENTMKDYGVIIDSPPALENHNIQKEDQDSMSSKKEENRENENDDEESMEVDEEEQEEDEDGSFGSKENGSDDDDASDESDSEMAEMVEEDPADLFQDNDDELANIARRKNEGITQEVDENGPQKIKASTIVTAKQQDEGENDDDDDDEDENDEYSESSSSVSSNKADHGRDVVVNTQPVLITTAINQKEDKNKMEIESEEIVDHVDPYSVLELSGASRPKIWEFMNGNVETTGKLGVQMIEIVSRYVGIQMKSTLDRLVRWMLCFLPELYSKKVSPDQFFYLLSEIALLGAEERSAIYEECNTLVRLLDFLLADESPCVSTNLPALAQLPLPLPCINDEEKRLTLLGSHDELRFQKVEHLVKLILILLSNREYKRENQTNQDIMVNNDNQDLLKLELTLLFSCGDGFSKIFSYGVFANESNKTLLANVIKKMCYKRWDMTIGLVTQIVNTLKSADAEEFETVFDSISVLCFNVEDEYQEARILHCLNALKETVADDDFRAIPAKMTEFLYGMANSFLVSVTRPKLDDLVLNWFITNFLKTSSDFLIRYHTMQVRLSMERLLCYFVNKRALALLHSESDNDQYTEEELYTWNELSLPYNNAIYNKQSNLDEYGKWMPISMPKISIARESTVSKVYDSHMKARVDMIKVLLPYQQAMSGLANSVDIFNRKNRRENTPQNSIDANYYQVSSYYRLLSWLVRDRNDVGLDVVPIEFRTMLLEVLKKNESNHYQDDMNKAEAIRLLSRLGVTDEETLSIYVPNKAANDQQQIGTENILSLVETLLFINETAFTLHYNQVYLPCLYELLQDLVSITKNQQVVDTILINHTTKWAISTYLMTHDLYSDVVSAMMSLLAKCGEVTSYAFSNQFKEHMLKQSIELSKSMPPKLNVYDQGNHENDAKIAPVISERKKWLIKQGNMIHLLFMCLFPVSQTQPVWKQIIKSDELYSRLHIVFQSFLQENLSQDINGDEEIDPQMSKSELQLRLVQLNSRSNIITLARCVFILSELVKRRLKDDEYLDDEAENIQPLPIESETLLKVLVYLASKSMSSPVSGEKGWLSYLVLEYLDTCLSVYRQQPVKSDVDVVSETPNDEIDFIFTHQLYRTLSQKNQAETTKLSIFGEFWKYILGYVTKSLDSSSEYKCQKGVASLSVEGTKYRLKLLHILLYSIGSIKENDSVLSLFLMQLRKHLFITTESGDVDIASTTEALIRDQLGSLFFQSAMAISHGQYINNEDAKTFIKIASKIWSNLDPQMQLKVQENVQITISFESIA